MTNASKTCGMEKLKKKSVVIQRRHAFFDYWRDRTALGRSSCRKIFHGGKLKISFFFVNSLDTNMRNAIKSFKFVIKLKVYKRRMFSKKTFSIFMYIGPGTCMESTILAVLNQHPPCP